MRYLAPHMLASARDPPAPQAVDDLTDSSIYAAAFLTGAEIRGNLLAVPEPGALALVAVALLAFGLTRAHGHPWVMSRLAAATRR